MFDFEKPNIEIAEISEDKKYGKFVENHLKRGDRHYIRKFSEKKLRLSSFQVRQSVR